MRRNTEKIKVFSRGLTPENFPRGELCGNYEKKGKQELRFTFFLRLTAHHKRIYVMDKTHRQTILLYCHRDVQLATLFLLDAHLTNPFFII